MVYILPQLTQCCDGLDVVMLQAQNDVSAVGEEKEKDPKKERDKRRETGNKAKIVNFRNWQLCYHFY